MKKLISFKVLKELCGYSNTDGYVSLYFNNECCHILNEDKPCKSKNCPIWKKLEAK